MRSRRAGGWWSVAVGLLCAGLTSLHAYAPARAQGLLSATQMAAQNGSLGFQSQKLSYLDKNGTPSERGISCTELIAGNGTRAGYTLTHGGLIPGTIFVSAGAQSMKVDTDVFIDYAAGSLYFAEAVRRLDTIRVTYDYVKSQDSARTTASLPGLALNFGTTSLNFVYGMSAAGMSGLDFTTYGLGMTSKLTKGASLSSMFYVSTPNQSNQNRVVDYTKPSAAPQARAGADQAKADHAILQDLNVTSGKTTLRASYQDVGLAFNGFQAMRQAYTGNATALAEIGTLEKEKGIRRLGLGMTMASSKTSSLGMDWSQIEDATGSIQKGGLAYTSGHFKLSYATQSVGQSFAAFGNLHDATAAQWAKEHGISRNDLSLGLDVGRGGLLGFTDDTIGDTSGKLTREAFNLTTKALNIAFVDRSATAGFSRIADITDAEKTQLALDIRQQFDMNATAAQVTQKDRDQLALDAGLTRERIAVGGTLSKTSTFQVNQVDISDGSGSIDRTALGLKTGNLTLNYLDQDISAAYARLSAMSDFEKAQFGNETGIHRSALGMNLNLDKTSSLAFSEQGFNDKDGGLSRESFGYKTKGLEAHFNLSDTDKGFTRAGDLAGLTDADRQLINNELGFRRMDFTGKLSLIRGLLVDAYDYDARNPSDLLTRSIYRYNLAWNPTKKLAMTYLTEGNSYDQDGKPVDARAHELLTFDQHFNKGMRFSFLRDMLAQTTGGQTIAPITTDLAHFETDRSQPKNLMLETKLVDFGNSHFEDTFQLDAAYRASKALNLHFNNTTIDRGNDPSLATNSMLWNWQVNRAVNFAGSFAQTDTNNNQNVMAQSYTVTTPVSKALNIAGTFSEIVTENTDVKTTKDVALSNRATFNALGMKQVTLTAKFSSVDDQQKLQSEAVGGRMQGFIGKNQVAVEYSGAATPQNTSAVTRSVSFVSDRNAKLPLMFDVLYKARNINGSDVQLVRLYNLTYKVDKVMSLTYTYSSLPEAANQVMQQVRSSGVTLSRVLTKTLSFSENYSSHYDYSQNVKTNRFATALTGHLDKLSAIEVGYNVDVNTANGANQNAHTARVSFDRQLSTDKYIAVNMLYTLDHVSNVDDTRVNFDFKTRF